MKYNFQDIDERIIKTRIALTGAIFEIIKRHNTVKVLDICKEANIAPMTYYHHFNNKNHLLEYAIRQQLENKLPIPRKLKPQNMKQLIAYLIKMFSEFANANYEVINASLNKIKTKGYEGSYIQLLFLVYRSLIEQEIKLIFNTDNLMISIWTNIITYGLCLSIIKQKYQFSYVWNSLKVLLNNL